MQVALQQAEQILTLNKPILDKIAKKLIEKEILNEDEIYTLANMKKPAAA
jgi:Peptidase family M41.